ncbi:unnamed protein product [Malus baccata var. baccata]
MVGGGKYEMGDFLWLMLVVGNMRFKILEDDDHGEEKQFVRDRARKEEEEAGFSKSHGFGRASLRTFNEASSPHESPLVPLNLVPAPIKHGTVVQSSPVPFNEAKQTHP